MIPDEFRKLSTGKTGKGARKAAARFLLNVWDYSPGAYTVLATRRGTRWEEHPIKGDRARKIAAILDAYPADRFDIYFCPNSFAEPRRLRSLALDTRYAWCDIDDADPDLYDPQPNILCETSPGRFQGIWRWRETLPGKIAEQISRNIWAKDGGDKGGWSVTKLLRLPGTINHKLEHDSPVVTLRYFDGRPQSLPNSILSPPPTLVPAKAETFSIDGLDAGEIMRRYRRKMGLLAGTLMKATRVMRPDRSGAVYMIVLGLIGAGASDPEIAAVLLVNPYFLSKWGADPETAFDQIARIRAKSGISR